MPAPVVSPAGASPRGKESTHFTITNGETARWSAAASPNATLYTNAGLTAVYNGTDYRSDIYMVAANETDTWNLVATNASSQATNVSVVVTAEFPPYWDFKTP